MSKPKQGGPQYEVPTEWRRIVMEEDKDGNVRPVAVEEAPIGSGVHMAADGSPTTSTEPPTDMPQEWHDILQSSDNGGHDAISIVNEGQEVGEHTIPGMRIPQLYDDDLASLDTNSGYSIDLHGSESPIPDRTTVGAAPPPPPDYEEFPFSSAPEGEAEGNGHAPRNPPLIVPAPQGESFSPPPQSVLAPEEGAVLGIPGNEAATPAAGLPAVGEVPMGTIEMDVPSAPEVDDSTNELDAHYPEAVPEPQEYSDVDAEVEDILRAEDMAVDESPDPFEDEEDTGAFNNLQLEPAHDDAGAESEESVAAVEEPAPAPVVAAFEPEALQALLAPMFEEMMALQRETLGQFERIQEDLGAQHEAQEEAQLKLEEIANVVEKQDDAREAQEQLLHQVVDAVAEDEEERRFHALHDIVQDLLLLYDFVDLRMRALWDQHGQDDPSTIEMNAVRERLLELLQRHGLSPIEISNPSFDPDSQRALQEILTMEPQEDGHISRIFRQGFRFGERVFRPSEVEVKRYPSS